MRKRIDTSNLKVIDKPFDEEERLLMEAVENNQLVEACDEEYERIQNIISGAKNITIRMQNADIEGLKKKASQAGIPYQTLINSILHRYLNGGIILKDAI